MLGWTCGLWNLLLVYEIKMWGINSTSVSEGMGCQFFWTSFLHLFQQLLCDVKLYTDTRYNVVSRAISCRRYDMSVENNVVVDSSCRRYDM